MQLGNSKKVWEPVAKKLFTIPIADKQLLSTVINGLKSISKKHNMQYVQFDSPSSLVMAGRILFG